MHKIKKGDLVKVITGKDKDKTGKVLSVNVKKNTVLVEGCNMVTKHTKPSAANQQGGIIHQEGALDISNADNNEPAYVLGSITADTTGTQIVLK